MRIKLQFAAYVLALLAIAAPMVPYASAQHGRAQGQNSPKPANHPPSSNQGSHPSQQGQHQNQNQAQHQQQHQQQKQQRQLERQQYHQQTHPNSQRNFQGTQDGAAAHGGNPDWNRPGGGAVHADRPPSANTPPKNFNNLSPQDKQRVLSNNRKWQNLSPSQRQQVQERQQVWQKMTPAQQNHIKNDVLPKWKQMPPDRKRAIQNRLGVLKNMPESARNEHLNDPNFTRGMSEEDKSTLRDLSHLHVGGSADSPNE
jgi:hypothetical protein